MAAIRTMISQVQIERQLLSEINVLRRQISNASRPVTAAISNIIFVQLVEQIRPFRGQSTAC